VKTQHRLTTRAIELADANAFVAQHHRHHKPCVGHRFSMGAFREDGTMVGIAIVGRPVARMVCPRTVLEVTRLATDGTPNACSVLYAATARVGKELGYWKIQTYILESEPGTSVKAAGWMCEGEAGGGKWKHTDGKPRREDQPTCKKQRWSRILNASRKEAA
jgi:hypothetical protein